MSQREQTLRQLQGLSVPAVTFFDDRLTCKPDEPFLLKLLSVSVFIFFGCTMIGKYKPNTTTPEVVQSVTYHSNRKQETLSQEQRN